ncbi:isochorismate synthase [Herbiconiux flava]|uniref:isochorismate synthase n=1 Tax=Herbiconiux flava TaxID=881268 RepID=A0A852SA08_9MICO|nr:isochorismate synthase [Herbiconiux flava]NYD69096.1 menaquinone-specific isochorismate synthase [Herbiconiux flava]GLK15844.1 isochorismate synthase [Herbiconiux flava]
MSDSAVPTVPRLIVETHPVDDVKLLIPLIDPRHPLVWLRKGQGMAGIGEALRLEFGGAGRMLDACAAWKDVVAAARVTDPVKLPGSGLIAFGTFAFADDSAATSTLIVPRVVIGKRDGRFWVTKVRVEGSDEPLPTAMTRPLGPEYRLTLLPGEVSADGFRASVDAAVERISAQELDKVVLARDLVGHLPAGADLRRPLTDLALGYPDCWTYAVDGFVGSSPETLVRVSHGTVSARVLAGTTARGADAQADHDQAVALATSPKDLDEHGFAVSSVLAALRPHSRSLTTSELPFTLKLPNLWHLASDVEGVLSDGSTSLDLIAALHPTAAVAGTPTETALRVIHELEPFDRGRYAGPVGWVGADGDGEWAVALRSAQVDEAGDITAYAGCGIVADSDAEREYLETKMKFRPIVEAFG